jgi:dienelactone hydrolase
MKNMLRIFVVVLFVISSSILFAQKGNKHYTEKELFISKSEGTMYGTLVTPLKVKKPPLVVFFTGSMGTDRDGNMVNNPRKNNWVAYLADSLAARGIASFRYDKLGSGKSVLTNKSLSMFDITIKNHISGALSWLMMFSKQKNDYSKIVVFGHQESAIFGIVGSNVVSVDGFIAVNAPGTTIDTLIEKLYFPSIPEKLKGIGNHILSEMRNGRVYENVPTPLVPLFGKDIQPILISSMKFNPAEKIKDLKCPILIVYGEYDMDSPESEVLKLAAAAQNATVKKIPMMNNILKEVKGNDLKNREAYSIPILPIIDGVTDVFVKFIESLP